MRRKDRQKSGGFQAFPRFAFAGADIRQFAKSFIEAIAMHRPWDRQERMHVPA